MAEEKKTEEMQNVEVVPINVILGELEIIKQKLYPHVLVLQQTKDTEDVKSEEVPDVKE